MPNPFANRYRLGIAIALPVFAVACASSPDPEPIKIVATRPDPQQCEYLAQAVGKGSEGLVSWTSAQEEAEDAITDIARQRQGNVVHVERTQRHKFGHSEERTLYGQVYRCP